MKTTFKDKKFNKAAIKCNLRLHLIAALLSFLPLNVVLTLVRK